MFMLLFCLVSFWFVYDRSYKVLWFKTQQLFDILPSSSLTDSVGGSASVVSFATSNDRYLLKFYSEYSISSKIMYKMVRSIFSATFAAYVVTIEIVLWQIKKSDSTGEANIVTSLLWPLVLGVLFVSLVLVQPFLILLFLLNKFFDDKVSMHRLVTATIVTTVVWLLLLHNLQIGPFGHTYNLLTKVSVVGVSVMGILSGLASASTPYYAVQFFRKRNKSDLKHGMHHRVSILWIDEASLREQIVDYEELIEKNASLLSQMQASSTTNADMIVVEELKEKISCCQLELVKLNNKLRDPKEVRALKQMFQLVFLVYCIYKLFNVWFDAIPKIISHSIKFPSDTSYEYFNNDTNKKDPLAITIAGMLDFLIFRFQHQDDIDSLVKQISLFLSISLFVCSLSTVTTTISYLLTLLPMRLQVLALSAMRSSGSGNELPKSTKDANGANRQPSLIKNLAVSELTGIYILATVLMIRSNLPFDVSKKVNELLGQRFIISNAIIDVWSDTIFAWSSVLTLIGIKIAEKTLRV